MCDLHKTLIQRSPGPGSLPKGGNFQELKNSIEHTTMPELYISEHFKFNCLDVTEDTFAETHDILEKVQQVEVSKILSE